MTTMAVSPPCSSCSPAYKATFGLLHSPQPIHGRRTRSRFCSPPPRRPSSAPVLPRSPPFFSPRQEGEASPSSDEGAEAYGSFFGENVSGRRGMIFLAATLPQLLFHNAGSTAQEPDKTSIIHVELRRVLSKAKAAGLLRLAFHDGGTVNMNENTGGMNGSIIYELDRPENIGLARSVKVLDKCKNELDKVLSVSWADLIAIAGSEAVSLCGGPLIPVKLGRMDSSVPDPPDQLPLESLDAAGLKKTFLQKGFSTQELVALSGAHTLGNKGFGNPFVFDNSYYKILLEKPWTSAGEMGSMIGLPSDRALVDDDECLSWVKVYADDQARFFDDFSRAYVKLVDSGASWR